jgi:ABC-2 type transport system ATP-binding protein
MKKKLALACTLIHTPELILLDEPSTGVDPVSRGEFWNILSEIQAHGVTVLMTTPYLDEAERCSRIGMMHKGRLLLHGTPDEVKSRSQGTMYRIDCPAPAAAYRLLRAEQAANLVLYGDRLHLRATAGEAEARAVAARLQAAALGPVSLHAITPSLEDVFVALLA